MPVFLTVCSSAVTPLVGRFSDIFSRQKVYYGSMIIFLIGSVLCGASVNIGMLIVFRGLQGTASMLLCFFCSLHPLDRFFFLSLSACRSWSRSASLCINALPCYCITSFSCLFLCAGALMTLCTGLLACCLTASCWYLLRDFFLCFLSR